METCCGYQYGLAQTGRLEDTRPEGRMPRTARRNGQPESTKLTRIFKGHGERTGQREKRAALPPRHLALRVMRLNQAPLSALKRRDNSPQDSHWRLRVRLKSPSDLLLKGFPTSEEPDPSAGILTCSPFGLTHGYTEATS